MRFCNGRIIHDTPVFIILHIVCIFFVQIHNIAGIWISFYGILTLEMTPCMCSCVRFQLLCNSLSGFICPIFFLCLSFHIKLHPKLVSIMQQKLHLVLWAIQLQKKLFFFSSILVQSHKCWRLQIISIILAICSAKFALKLEIF